MQPNKILVIAIACALGCTLYTLSEMSTVLDSQSPLDGGDKLVAGQFDSQSAFSGSVANSAPAATERRAELGVNEAKPLSPHDDGA